MFSNYVIRIAAIAFLFCALSFTSSFGQTYTEPSGNSGSGYAIVRIDYCSNWITTSYGGDKKTEAKLNRSKQLPIKDQISDLNNTLIDALNKLEKEGYRVVSSTSDVNEGSTCGITFLLYKNQ